MVVAVLLPVLQIVPFGEVASDGEVWFRLLDGREMAAV